MMSREPREAFLDVLSDVVEAAPFTIVAVVIDKRGLRLEDAESANLYHFVRGGMNMTQNGRSENPPRSSIRKSYWVACPSKPLFLAHFSD